MTLKEAETTHQQVLDENRRVHALENEHYLDRHPEQTNFFQSRLQQETLDEFDRHLARSGASVLEVGCGTGYCYLPLLNRGYQMTGVDVSSTLVEVLSSRIPGPSRSRSRLVCSDVETFLEENQETFDGIVCSALLHHLYDYGKIVDQLMKVLKPGGVMLIFFEPLKQAITHPGRYFLHRQLARLDEWVYKQVMRWRSIPLIEDDYAVADYQRQFGGLDPQALTVRLNEGGLGILETHTYCARRSGWAAWLANRVLHTQNTFNIMARKF